MKKLVTLLAAAGMVMAASAPASAIDTKIDARYRFSFQTGETGFSGVNEENVVQRLRLGLTFAASENLSGYANFQVGTDTWGTTNDTNGHNDGANFRTRMVYIDWKVPATGIKVRMGRQNIGLPADAFGDNGVISASWGTKDGIAVAAPVTDWLSLNALWVRVGYENDTTKSHDLDNNKSDDLFGLAANLKFNGVSGSVYGAYAALDGAAATGVTNVIDGGKGTNFAVSHGNAWWIGATATVSYFDPFTLKLSAAYGSFDASEEKTGKDTAGWNVQAKASYKTAFGTPVFGAWYFSGADKDGDGLMPSIGGYFRPTRAWNDGAPGLSGGNALGLPTGNWGVQAGIEKVSFLQGLSHDFLVTYIEGTNDYDAKVVKSNKNFLTEEDSLVSFDLVNTYQIYKNLAAHLQLSYILSDFEDGDAKTHKLNEDDWTAELTFEYKF